jgi:PST family polysaccharide transporter
MKIPAMISSARHSLAGNSAISEIATNAGWLFFDKLLRMLIGLAIGIWLARYLGVAQFGQLSYAIAFASLFSAVASFGLDKIVVRELVRDKNKSGIILGSAFTLKLAGGCLALLLAFLAIRLYQPGNTTAHWLVTIIAAGMIFQSLDIFDFWFQAQVQSKYTVYAKSTAFLVMSAVKIGLILSGAELIAFAWAALAEIVFGSIGLCMVYSATGNSFAGLKASREVITSFLSEGWPLLFSGLAIILYMRIDQVMLGNMAGEHEVGLYSAALTLSTAWYIIPTVIMSSLMPAITTSRSNSKIEYNQLMHKSFTLLARTAYIIAIPMTVLSVPLVTALYGTAYQAAGSILAIHIWAALFVFMGVAQGPWMINEGLAKISLYYTSSGAVLNIVLNYLLIPTYGAIGCAIATTASYGFSGWLANLLFSRTREIFYIQSRAIFLGIGK